LEQLATSQDIPFYSTEEWESDFDELFSRVENGETIGITDGKTRAVFVPVDDDLVKHLRDHDDGC
jgi:antitoxin (DNA-binding transcriptional repressor) of toxin-antitoxin stability system